MTNKEKELDKAIISNDGKGHKEIKSKLDVPDKLYKYYTLNGNSASSLENETIHLSHPFTLNDVLDGNFALTSDFERFFDLRPGLLSHYGGQRGLLTKLYTEFTKDWGVFSMCETFDNDLIWSHYTSEEGFCIEFDSQKLFSSIGEPKKHIFPVSYDLDKIDFEDYIFEVNNEVDSWIPLIHSMASKEKCWSYENEWRILVGKKDFSPISHKLHILDPEIKKEEFNKLKQRNLTYDVNAIQKVLLAPYFFNSGRFSKVNEKSNVLQYWFNKPLDNNLYKFLKKLKDDYNSKLYQVEKRYNSTSGKYKRRSDYKVKIMEVTEDYVEIKRVKI